MSASSPAPAKFRFDLDLGHRQEKNALLTESAMTALVNNARAEGYSDGLVEGQRAPTAGRAAPRQRRTGDRRPRRGAQRRRSTTPASRRSPTPSVSPPPSARSSRDDHLLAAEPTAEIEALITECLATLDAVPHLVIRCAPELADAVREIAVARIATSGFTGRLVVLGEPGMAMDDARLEWVDGGIARDRAQLEAEIDRRIAAFLAARRGHPRHRRDDAP